MRRRSAICSAPRPGAGERDLDDRRGRELLARHFVQRRRGDIRRYLTRTPRSRRTGSPKEVAYALSPEHKALFDKVLDYARERSAPTTVS